MAKGRATPPKPRKPREKGGRPRDPLAEARARIEEARVSGGTKLDLSLLAINQLPQGIVELTALQSLDLYDTQVSDLAPLAGLTALQILDLSSTQVSDLAPLAGLTTLQFLGLINTQVSYLAPLAGLTTLQRLDLSSTQVSDLAPLAGLTALQDGIVANSRNALRGSYGLTYAGTPVAGRSPFDQLSRLDQPALTVETINQVRRQQGLPAHIPEGYEGPGDLPEVLEQVPRDNWPQRLAELKQLPDGATFETTGERLAIAWSADPTDERAAHDPTTQQLHQQVRDKARRFALSAKGLDNQPGWRGIGASTERLLSYTDGDTPRVAQRIGDVWSVVVELGSFLDLDNQLRAKRDSSASPLDPEIRRVFADLIRTAAPWVRLFPTARKLDEESGAFLTRRDLLAPAEAVVEFGEPCRSAVPPGS